MSAVITIGAWGFFAALVGFGLLRDVLRTRDRREHIRDVTLPSGRPVRVVASRPPPDPLIDELERLYEMPCARSRR